MGTKKEKPTNQPTRRTVLAAGAVGGAAVVAAAALPGCNGDDPVDPGPIVTTPGPVQWGMYLDLAKCTGCKSCSVACKVQNEIPLGVWRREVKELEVGTYPNVERRFLPWLCNHCDDPPCVTRCCTDAICAVQVFPDGTEVPYLKRATYKRPDGMVLLDEDRCVGCGFCVVDCPYGARFFNEDKPAIASEHPDAGDYVASKCTYCVQRIENGVTPACVQTCPAEALMFGDVADASSAISLAIAAADATPLIATYNTTPKNRYSGYSEADVNEIFVDGTDVKDERCAVATNDSCRLGS